jgi:hypothetical protein
MGKSEKSFCVRRNRVQICGLVEEDYTSHRLVGPREGDHLPDHKSTTHTSHHRIYSLHCKRSLPFWSISEASHSHIAKNAKFHVIQIVCNVEYSSWAKLVPFGWVTPTLNTVWRSQVVFRIQKSVYRAVPLHQASSMAAFIYCSTVLFLFRNKST